MAQKMIDNRDESDEESRYRSHVREVRAQISNRAYLHYQRIIANDISSFGTTMSEDQQKTLKSNMEQMDYRYNKMIETLPS